MLVTNQSGIARGLLSEADYLATARRLDQLLGEANARLDGAYYCPHLPEISGPCDCRKPRPLLYQRATRDLDLDPARSWWVGDRLRDVEAAGSFGGRGILLLPGPAAEGPTATPTGGWRTAPDLAGAVDQILASAL